MNQLTQKATAVFYEYLSAKGLHPETVKRKKLELLRFLDYFSAKDLREIESHDIEDYFLWITESGFSKSTLGTAHSTISDFFMALLRSDMVMHNPMDLTDIIIKEKSGAKVILSENEMDTLLNSIETVTGYGLRDRAIFELMYGTGMRIGEVVRLNVADVDFSLNEILIRESKGRKDRIVPLGSVPKQYLEQWAKHSCSYFLKEIALDEGALFLGEKGVRISGSLVRYRLKHYLKLAGISKPGVSPHSFRHSCATHLLDRGADIIFVAELLGHESLETTCTYTKEIVNGLKKTHKMYHAREN